MADRIPFAKLGIPANLEGRVGPDAPRPARLAAARGLPPLPMDQQLGVLYLLAADPDPLVARTARRTLSELPADKVCAAIGPSTHPKVLEFLAEFHEPDPALDERIAMLRSANDRTVRLIARRAGARLCEMLCDSHERLLMVPELFLDLARNPNCPESALARARSFLRMQHALPEGAAAEADPESARPDAARPDAARPDAARPDAARPEPAPVGSGADLEAEIEAALAGRPSPALERAQGEALHMFALDDIDAHGRDEDFGMFRFDFADPADEFSWDLTEEHDLPDGEERAELQRSLERKVSQLTVGQKIKLAYVGNKEVRAILIRDPNRVVATAVVRSGRLTDSEVASFAGNRNLDSDVLREIAARREWLRKYTVKVALVNNPKTPVSVAVGLVGQLQKKDLLALTRNRNVPSVVVQAAARLYRQKYRKT